MSTWEARHLLSPSPTFLTAAAGKAEPSQLPPSLPPLGFQGTQPSAAFVFQFTAPVSPRSPQTSPSALWQSPFSISCFLRPW